MTEDVLRFRVQGSAPLPYAIVATGCGRDLEIHCRCAAGARRGAFCKHAMALLVGDITNVVEGSEFITALRERAEGSPLLTQAMLHPVSKRSQRIEGVGSPEEALAVCKSRLGSKCAVEFERDGERAAVNLIGTSAKTGRRLKNPFGALEYEPVRSDYQVAEDGSVVPFNVRPSVRPWVVRMKGQTTRTFADLGAALHVFLERAEETLPD